jgi:hypothetical protein
MRKPWVDSIKTVTSISSSQTPLNARVRVNVEGAIPRTVGDASAALAGPVTRTMRADPRTIDRVEVAPPSPEPGDCLLPGESIAERVRLPAGWVAVTDRRVVAYRGDREPSLATVHRQNVVGLSLRRAGRGPVVRYAPRIAAYGLLSVVVGLLFQWLAPSASVTVPESAPVAAALGFVDLFMAGLRVVGLLAVGAGVLALVGAGVAVGYRLGTGRLVLAIERAAADPVRCSISGGSAPRALDRLAAALEAPAKPTGNDEEQAAARAPAESGTCGREGVTESGPRQEPNEAGEDARAASGGHDR